MGDYYYEPFLQVGSTDILEQNINPTFSTGLAALMFGSGATTIHPSIFVTGSTVLEAKAMAWQLVYASYAQASFSKHPDILSKGRLVKGDNSIAWSCFGESDYTFEFGNIEVKSEVFQYGHEYFITNVHGSLSNLKMPQQRVWGGIWLNGKFIYMHARNQSSVYYYRDDLPYQPDQSLPKANPKLENGWLGFGYPKYSEIIQNQN